MQEDMLAKFVSASQVHLLNKYRNIKVKFLKCNPSLYFSKQWL